MIGRVGTIFGAHGINISSAAVGHTPDTVRRRRAPLRGDGRDDRRAGRPDVVKEIVASEGFVDGWSVDLGLAAGARVCAPVTPARGGDRLGSPAAMRAVVITKHGGPGVLQVQERPDPPLGPGEVRIEVAAAGINFADVMARMGLYRDAPKTPCVVGYEVAGTILELGEGVEGLAARPARAGRHAVRRLRLAGRRARGRRGRAARAAQLRAGRRDPRQLRHRLGGADRLRQPAAGRARARALRRRRRRHRRDADRQALRRRGLRHRLALASTSAAASSAWTARSTTRAPAGRRGSAVRHDPRRGRRQELPHELRPARARRAPGRLRRLLGRLRRAQKRRHGTQSGAAHAALQPDQADVRNRRP